MSEIIDRFSRYARRHPWANTIVSIIFGGLLINIASDLVSQEFGYKAILPIVIILFIIFLIMFTSSWYEERKRKKLKAEPTTEPLRERYKGLIASISLIKEPKEEIINKINSVKNLKDKEGLKKVYEVRGIGQTCRAIKHHLGKLEACWLLCTRDVGEGKELVEYFIKKFSSRTVKVKTIPLESPNKIESVHKAINEIYVKDIKEVNLNETEVIADVTGGTTIMSSAMTLACISRDRDIEYVEQKTYNLIKIDENISEVIFRG
jgi:uncharacterized membrane protein